MASKPGKLGRAAACTMSVVLALSLEATSAFAAETSYSYMAGVQQNSDRHIQFERAAANTEFHSFFVANDIGGSPYSTSQHMDVLNLLAEGVIDQATADRSSAYAAEKHEGLHAGYADLSNLTPQERHSYHADLHTSVQGDSVDGLLL